MLDGSFMEISLYMSMESKLNFLPSDMAMVDRLQHSHSGRMDVPKDIHRSHPRVTHPKIGAATKITRPHMRVVGSPRPNLGRESDGLRPGPPSPPRFPLLLLVLVHPLRSRSSSAFFLSNMLGFTLYKSHLML